VNLKRRRDCIITLTPRKKGKKADRFVRRGKGLRLRALSRRYRVEKGNRACLLAKKKKGGRDMTSRKNARALHHLQGKEKQHSRNLNMDAGVLGGRLPKRRAEGGKGERKINGVSDTKREKSNSENLPKLALGALDRMRMQGGTPPTTEKRERFR